MTQSSSRLPSSAAPVTVGAAAREKAAEAAALVDENEQHYAAAQGKWDAIVDYVLGDFLQGGGEEAEVAVIEQAGSRYYISRPVTVDGVTRHVTVEGGMSTGMEAMWVVEMLGRESVREKALQKMRDSATTFTVYANDIPEPISVGRPAASDDNGYQFARSPRQYNEHITGVLRDYDALPLPRPVVEPAAELAS